MECVYMIKVNGIVRYIGRTNDLVRREAQHNYLCFKKLTKKQLYKEIRKYETLTTIKLQKVKSFQSKVDAKRWECYLILNDYFGKKQLWQTVPRISDI